MRKDSTNIFNQGLNYDLNPITTPENVLTDCVNGTFITFNGDELALQNDAGNTKIAVPGSDPVEYVELSPGFQPLGIKEYGGVLYIVSARRPQITNNQFELDGETYTLKGEWVSGTTYDANDIVTKVSFGVVKYYLAKKETEDDLPNITNAQWEVVGEEKDYYNRFSEVEFGSYPSPEASGIEEYPGDEKEYNEDTTFDMMYKKFIINQAFFKTTRYVEFEELKGVDDRDTDAISGYTINSQNFIEYNPLFYKVKLYHQLDNGYLDLTDDLWARYNEYLRDQGADLDGNFWFTDEFFRYYCPSQYKGKLALSLEIEDLTTFELYGFPTFTFDASTYEFTLRVKAEGTGMIDVPQVKVEIWIDGVKHDFAGNDYELVDVGNTVGRDDASGGDFGALVAEFVLPNISADDQDKEIKYRVTPIIEVNGQKYGEIDIPAESIEKLPEEYIEKFVIEGFRLINTEYDDIDFILGGEECYTETATKLYHEAVLVDKRLNYLTPSLAPSPSDQYVFLWHLDAPDAAAVTAWETANPGKFVIATFLLGFRGLAIMDIYRTEIPQTVLNIFKLERMYITDIENCGSTDPEFAPTIVGVGSDGIPTLLDDSGEYIKQAYNIEISDLGAHDNRRNIVDYNATDKLVFVGGKNGTLHIFDVNDPQAIGHKAISVYSDQFDLAAVRIIYKKTGSTVVETEIMISSSDNAAYRQKYYPNMSSYVDNIDSFRTGVLSGSDVGHVKDFHYDGGYYYSISNDLEIHRSNDLSEPWQRITDLRTHGYRMNVGSDKMWYLGHRDGSDRIIWAYRSNPTALTNLKPDLSSNNIIPREIIMLKGDESLILTNDYGNSIFRLNNDMTSQNLTPYYTGNPSSCYYNNTGSYMYTGGAAFDGSKYAYLEVSKYVGTTWEHKVMKYNAYPDNMLEAMFTNCMDVPAYYTHLFIY